MPVAVILPAIAGFAASSFAASAFAIGTLGAIAVGAVAGAVVGGIGAAITGGDILEGVLYGAVGGAVGGYLGGAFTTGEWSLFGSSGAGGTTNISAGSTFEGVLGSNITGLEGTGSLLAQDTVINLGGGSGGLFSGMSDMAQYGLISGGADMLKGLGTTEAYGNTKEAQDAAIAAAKDKSKAELEAQKEIAKLNAETSRANAELSASTTREGYTSQERQAEEAIAQRKLELVTPYEQAAASRDRSRETASGLTLARKQAEQQQDPYALV